ncbi:hypothetical protein A0J61_06548 [Choanephora cucurbitarum]|uniref:Uncharacterized protein n=1 Tax=Choanephora cucurbitarum TaxID=101091 RepID=A0A1C7N8E6_9FUNG|nr:hypothetical protein A0J61_06550 [Choanephora cucurbitarum]OBZ85402.1 hypothetical protein A0J61_06548 [Choanephora cucurbitarum]
MASHCGNRFACHNVFRSLFIASAKPCLPTRRFSSALAEQAKTLPVPQQKADFHYYQQLLKQHAKMVHRKESQLKAENLLRDMKQCGLEPNHQTYFHLVLGLSWLPHRNQHQNDRMESWFYEYLRLQRDPKRKRPQVKLKKLLKDMAIYGHPHLKTMFLHMVQLFEHELDSGCWNSAIKGCINAKQFEDAEHVFDMARERNVTRLSTYEIMIRAYLSNRDQKASSRIFEYMIRDQITAKCSVYQSFIDFYTSLKPDKDTQQTVARLWQAMLIMTTDSRIPNDTIQKLLVYFRKNRQLAVAEQIYLDLKIRNQRLKKEHVKEMHSVIIGFAHRQQLPSALSITYDLLADGYELEDKVIYSVVEACIHRNDREAAQQLVDMVNAVQPKGLSDACHALLEQ